MLAKAPPPVHQLPSSADPVPQQATARETRDRLTAARRKVYVDRVVATAPPFTPEQQTNLTLLMVVQPTGSAR